MSYTTIAQVVGMFPSFNAAGPKGPSSTLITQFMNDVAAEINAVLRRRFSEAIQSSGTTTSFSAWISSLMAGSADVQNLLEKINRFGTCAEMAAVFESLGVATYAKLGQTYGLKYRQLLNRLNARDDNGKLRPEGGDYDFLFDVNAKIETPRPQIQGIAGGDQSRQTLEQEGMYSKFGRDDPHGT